MTHAGRVRLSVTHCRENGIVSDTRREGGIVSDTR